jgi:hypothetical protein
MPITQDSVPPLKLIWEQLLCNTEKTGNNIPNDYPFVIKIVIFLLTHTLGYSREHITRAFSSMYKVTPTRYFNARRINAAVEKLYRGETVQSVAEQRLLTTAVQNILCRRDTSNFFAFCFWKCKKTKPVCLRWALAFI